MGNTVSCYFLDPEGNCLEIYALVAERDQARINRPLDLDKSVDEIVAQASGLVRLTISIAVQFRNFHYAGRLSIRR